MPPCPCLPHAPPCLPHASLMPPSCLPYASRREAGPRPRRGATARGRNARARKLSKHRGQARGNAWFCGAFGGLSARRINLGAEKRLSTSRCAFRCLQHCSKPPSWTGVRTSRREAGPRPRRGATARARPLDRKTKSESTEFQIWNQTRNPNFRNKKQ